MKGALGTGARRTLNDFIKRLACPGHARGHHARDQRNGQVINGFIAQVLKTPDCRRSTRARPVCRQQKVRCRRNARAVALRNGAS